MDLIFTGEYGFTPDEETVEFAVLAACCTKAAWPTVRGIPPEEFAQAIDKLKRLGWGFEWVTVQ